MSNTGSRFTDGELIHGNLSVLSNCSNDGSIEAEGSLYINNIIEYNFGSAVTIQNTVFNSDGSVIIPSTNNSIGLFVQKGVHVISDSFFEGIVHINNTVSSTSTSTGSLIVYSEAIEENLNVGGIVSLLNEDISLISLGKIIIYDSTNASSTDGSLFTYGGISIQKDLYVKENIYVNQINGNTGSFANLYVGNANVVNSTLNNSIIVNNSVSNLVGINVTASNVNISNENVLNSTITYANILNASIGNVNLTNVTAQSIYIETGYANNLTITSLCVTNELSYTDWVTNLSNVNLINTYASIGHLQLVSGTFGNLYGDTIITDLIDVNKLLATDATLSNLHVINSSYTKDFIAVNETIMSSVIHNVSIGTLFVTATQPSLSSIFGSVVLQGGGLSINCTVNSTSITTGGGLTIRGGLAVYMDVHIGGKTYMHDTLDLDKHIIANVTAPSVDLDVANKWYVDQRFLNFTTGSVNGNFTAGQVIIASSGGNIQGYSNFLYDGTLLSLLNTEDATSLTDGGTLFVGGGASIDKQLYVGSNAHILGYLDMNNQKITSLGICTTPYDAANKWYVDTRFDQFTIGNVNGNFTAGQVIVASTNGNITGFDSFVYNGTTLSI